MTTVNGGVRVVGGQRLTADGAVRVGGDDDR